MNFSSFRNFQAIFLDRDGVINRERKDYVKSWEEFEYLPGAQAALQRLATYPCPILVVTNQSAIGRGLVSAEAVNEIHHLVAASVCEVGGRLDGFFVCPHRPDEMCGCRKPRPGLLLQAAQQFNLQLDQCLLIGDSLTDYQAAAAVNCPAILVNSGHDPIRDMPTDGTHVAVLPDLFSVVMTILDAPGKLSKVEV